MAILFYPENFLHRNTGGDPRTNSKLGLNSGEGGFVTDILWLMITPRSVVSMADNARGGNAIESTIATDFPSYAFPLPSDFNFTLDPQWKKFDTVAGAANEMKSQANKSYKAGGAVGTGGINGFGAKNDSPFVYEDTERLTYSFTFELMAESWPNGSADVKRQVYDPVSDFMRMASPVNTEGGENAGANVQMPGFKFPYVFSLSSFYFLHGSPQPTDVIQVDDAACTSVQPTFSGPYVGGYPIKGKLTMSFTDLRPVYRDSISQGAKSKVTVKVNGK